MVDMDHYFFSEMCHIIYFIQYGKECGNLTAVKTVKEVFFLKL